MVNCYALLSHSTADRRFVFGLMVSNQSRFMWALAPARVRFVTSPFHCLHELDKQIRPT